MQITWIADTLKAEYRVPCNLEGEPIVTFRFKAKFMHSIQFRYELRLDGELHLIKWRGRDAK